MKLLQDLDKYADTRVKNWFLMSSPIPTIIISILYVVLVKKIGPQLMKNRKPFKLKNVIIYYNAVQVVFSTYLFYVMSKYGWLRFNSLFCEPVNLEENELASGVWWYFIAKFTEFIDTVFFVLRKKDKQISTLHVFHHSVVPTVAWIGVKYEPGGTWSIFGVINSFVHIVMYGYYMFAAMGPKYEKYLWWKKYLTVLQMIQFAIILSHSILLINSDCKVNKTVSYVILLLTLVLFVLFFDFYMKTYTKNQERQKMIQTQSYKTDLKKSRSLIMSPGSQ